MLIDLPIAIQPSCFVRMSLFRSAKKVFELFLQTCLVGFPFKSPVS